MEPFPVAPAHPPPFAGGFAPRMPRSETSAPSLLHGLQTLRGIFAVLVVCHHIAVHSARYWTHEWLGGIFADSTYRIDFFFVLSGFVLWAAHRTDAGTPAATRRFLFRRFWRLYPLLIVLSFFKVLLLCIFPGRDITFFQVVRSLLALPQTTFPIIVSAWTLSFEMYFMGVLALCLALPRRYVLPVLLSLAVLLAGAGSLLGVRPAISGAGFFTHPFILQFAAGVLVAECTGRLARRSWGILLSSVALLGLLFGAGLHDWLFYQPVIWQKLFWAAVFATGIGGLVLWERSVQPECWWLRDYWCLGRASYSIFLSHGFVLMAVFDGLDPERLGHNPLCINGFFVVVAFVAGLFGLAVWRWVERPLTRWCKSLWCGHPSMQHAAEAGASST